MPNQNKCDHIYGISKKRPRELKCSNAKSWLKGMRRYARSGDALILVLYDDDIKSCFVTFSTCLNCGAKIDWEKIKEACDAENNK